MHSSSRDSGSGSDGSSNTPGSAFPPTLWSKLAALRDATPADRDALLDQLLRRYWKPVYCYLRRAGCAEQDAKDLVQAFFADCLDRDLFDRADPTRGRFRNFLLRALEHFLAHERRAAAAQKRRPPGGLVSLDEPVVSDSSQPGVQPAAPETPAAVFQRAWVTDLVHRVLRRLEQECRATGKQTHYELLRRHLVLPALEGVEPPPLRELAAQFGLTEKQAANRLLTARHAYQRLLREEIRTYAGNEEEVEAEIRELFRSLGEE